MLEAILPRYVEAGLVDIPSGVDANKSRPAGRTPLMGACLSAKYTEAKMLLKAGASRYLKDSTGDGPLRLCLSGTSMACLQLLLGTAPDWHYTPEQLNDATTSCSVLATAEAPMRANCSSLPALTRMRRCFTKVHSSIMLILHASTGLTDQSWQHCSIQAQCRSHSHRRAARTARRAASSCVRAPSVTQRSTAAVRASECTGARIRLRVSAPRTCSRPIAQSTRSDHGRDIQIPVDRPSRSFAIRCAAAGIRTQR